MDRLDRYRRSEARRLFSPLCVNPFLHKRHQSTYFFYISHQIIILISTTPITPLTSGTSGTRFTMATFGTTLKAPLGPDPWKISFLSVFLALSCGGLAWLAWGLYRHRRGRARAPLVGYENLAADMEMDAL